MIRKDSGNVDWGHVVFTCQRLESVRGRPAEGAGLLPLGSGLVT